MGRKLQRTDTIEVLQDYLWHIAEGISHRWLMVWETWGSDSFQCCHRIHYFDYNLLWSVRINGSQGFCIVADTHVKCRPAQNMWLIGNKSSRENEAQKSNLSSVVIRHLGNHATNTEKSFVFLFSNDAHLSRDDGDKGGSCWESGLMLSVC